MRDLTELIAFWSFYQLMTKVGAAGSGLNVKAAQKARPESLVDLGSGRSFRVYVRMGLEQAIEEKASHFQTKRRGLLWIA